MVYDTHFSIFVKLESPTTAVTQFILRHPPVGIYSTLSCKPGDLCYFTQVNL